MMQVIRISPKCTHNFILEMHYAQRLPPISYAYGLTDDNNELVAVLTIGKPSSHSLCVGICGKEYSKNVYELNRLVAIPKLPSNTLSYFVGSVLREFKNTELIIVSYADEGAGHKGYIYQSTNWWYTGKTKERTDKYTPKGKHSRHYTNDYNYLRKFRTSKHRYVYVPNKKLRNKVKEIINYTIYSEYPKGENSNYVLGERLKTKIKNNKTGEIWYE